MFGLYCYGIVVVVGARIYEGVCFVELGVGELGC